MSWITLFANLMMVIVSCIKLHSAFKGCSRNNAQLRRNVISTALDDKSIAHRTPSSIRSQKISMSRRKSLCILQMSDSSEKFTSNQRRTITIGVNERYGPRKDQNATESEDYVAPTPFVPLVLTLTG
jgi:hypothetical protein